MPDVIRRALRLVDDIETIPEELADVIMLIRLWRRHSPAPLIPPALAIHSAKSRRWRRLFLVVGMGQIKTVLLAGWRWNGNFGPVQRLVWEKSLGTASAARVLCEQLDKRYRDELNLTACFITLGKSCFFRTRNSAPFIPTC